MSAMIAALYVLLTYIAHIFGLDSKAIQVRFSEALCVFPVFSSAAIPGLVIGCIISNLIFTGNIFDIVLGSLATLIGAVFTRLLRNRSPFLFVLPPIISNVVIVPIYLWKVFNEPYWLSVIGVAAGEIISVGVLGIILYYAVKKRNVFKFRKNKK